MNNHGVDQRSIGMCFASIFLKIWADMTLNEVATGLAAIAAITTILYNLQRMYKEWRNK
jgi:hypothetical protein